jgi:uncharacterized repeat protein (TIGR01451 family)
MKVSKILAAASITGIAAAGIITSPALAWHPKGVIVKYVQNQTAGGERADANNAASAVSAKTGDVLKYTIEIRNDGQKHDKGWNDMHFTKLTDTLPAGVELVSDASKRTIVEEIGRLKAGEKVTKEYLVKVTSTTDGDVIENEACFTGDSEVKDAPQEGCDPAVVKVSVPPKEEPPVEEPPVEEPPVEEPPVEETPPALPETGASSFIAPVAAVGSGALAYAGRLLVIKRRQQ